MTIDAILAQLDSPEPGYRREALDAAVAAREAITPRLLERLDAVLADPEAWVAKRASGVLYTVVLLSHFQEARAHERILRLCRLREEQLDELIGDMVTENLPAVLLRTAGDSVDGIKGLIEAYDASEFCRMAAIRALTYVALEGRADREAVLAYLDGLLTGKEAPEHSLFWSGVARGIVALHGRGYRDRLLWALNEGELIDPFFLGEADIARGLDAEMEEQLERERVKLRAQVPEDIHGYLAGWAGFRESPEGRNEEPWYVPEDADTPRDVPGPRDPGGHQPISATSAKRKKRRKDARKARKANRSKR